MERVEKVKNLIVEDPENIWMEYDKVGDTLYIGFSKDEEEETIMLENDMIINIKDNRLISLLIPNFKEKTNI
ncbi:Protein of unknown function (DUF2283) [Caldisphaera lagunensis DSM 15908]|uniref:DUF2283 domain-containing protein n=1 Tax=Caldisphaera lagunensis (strain DSM 15908 / JCM 11604 / ANMR 0165 / IC-154) TaxID=1056495 RepID=L0ABN3_CALLD|nr:DUF2283 domain-containing protein [Caldisphaera lagunensis]AFZ70834.1 Protein of unknown function (DUF2283) [Caldisphaera lagunensis DSM 15908]